MEEIELNLNNPIFALYVDSSNISRQSLDMMIQSYRSFFKCYTNITVWIILADYTKMECIYRGDKPNNIEKKILETFDKISSINNIEEIKSIVRDFKINNLLNIDNEE